MTQKIIARYAYILVSICFLSFTCPTSIAQNLPGIPVKSPFAQNSRNAATDPSAANGTTTQTNTRSEAEIDEQLEATQKKLVSLQAELSKAQNQFNATPVSNAQARQASQETITFLQKLVDYQNQNIDSLKDLRRLIDKASELKKAKDNWQPPLGSAPWPLATGDEVQFSINQWQYQAQHLNQRLSLVDEQLDEMKKSRAKYEIEHRQNSANPDQPEKIESSKRRLEINAAALSDLLLEKEVVITERQIALTNITIQRQNWKYYNNRFTYGSEDLQKTKTSLEKEITKQRDLEALASAKINRSLDNAANAKKRLVQLESTPNTPAATILQANRDWRLADNQAEAARLEREKERVTIELANIQIQLWTIRHDLYSSELSAESLDKLKERQQVLQHRVNQGMQYLTQMIAEKAQTYFELTEQAKSSKDRAEQAFLNEMIKPISEQVDNARAIYLILNRVNQLFEITQNEIQSKISNRSLKQKLDTIKFSITDVARAFWNYEIFAIDDIIVVDGRELKTKRSVTIGKSLGAIAILIIGFMLISRLIRRTLAIAVNKAHLGASKSVVIGRWLMLFAGFTLIITAFNLVEIPLSIFAFFGGALAIGIGFGTQNILKNLISGVILLIEKPIRIGDLVEIDDVTGVVTSIGIRFSTIHGAQGTDTLIPNSALVEHKLVNWTYSTPDIRKEIKITVAYNSDVDAVCSILNNVCIEHPSVMDSPAPLVTLDDFGDNGIVFTLQCWMRVQPGLVVGQVLSQLRISILAAFKENGIDLPFPQRVIQFDTSQPLEVNVLSQPGSQQA